MRQSVVACPFLCYQEVFELQTTFMCDDVDIVRLKFRVLVLHFVEEEFFFAFLKRCVLVNEGLEEVIDVSLSRVEGML
jgi:hypothetical protein